MIGFTSSKVEKLYRLLPRKKPKPSRPSKRFLICNQGGLGDVFLSNYLVESIKKTYPDCEIGMLVAPEGSAAVDRVDHHHVHPHWFQLNKSRRTLYFRFLYFLLVQRRRMAKELSNKNYDCAIVANPYFSGMAHVLNTARIPHCVGFETIGDRKYLSKVVSWRQRGYLLERYKHLLETLNINAPIPPASASKIEKNAVIFHMFSANSQKDLPLIFWKKLYALFLDEGYTVYFTGKGNQQREEIAKIVDETYNLCDRYDWEGFVEAIQTSALLVSVDTAAVHIEAAANKRFLAIYRQTPHFDLWYPPSEKGRALHWPVSPEEVLKEVKDESCC